MNGSELGSSGGNNNNNPNNNNNLSNNNSNNNSNGSLGSGAIVISGNTSGSGPIPLLAAGTGANNTLLTVGTVTGCPGAIVGAVSNNSLNNNPGSSGGVLGTGKGSSVAFS